MEYIDLNKDWRFYESDESMSFIFSRPKEEHIDLPHDFIIRKPRAADAPGGSGNGYFSQGEGVYKKYLAIPRSWKEKTVLLDIDGAYMNTEVAVDQELVSLHPYGYTPWLVDLTPVLRFDGKGNELKILTQSRQPSSRWYSGGGLYRSVGLWVGGKTCINPWDIFITTQEIKADSAKIKVTVTVSCREKEGFLGTLTVTAYNPKGQRSAQKTIQVKGDGFENNTEGGCGGSRYGYPSPDSVKTKKIQCEMIELEIDRPYLWDTIHPYLYTYTAELTYNDGTVADRATGTFGIRTILADARHGLRLNGKCIKLKGGCIHHDNGLLGACAYPKAEERKIRLMQAAGYNAVRISHHPPSRAMLEACDRLGMLLLDECFDVWRMGKTPMDYHLYFEDWWERDMEAMVRRDRNHPCVICYSIGNEVGERDGHGGGCDLARRLSDKIKSLDATRPTLTAICGVFDDDGDIGTNFDANAVADEKDVWGTRTEKIAESVDIVGYNYLYQRYEKDHVRWPDRVMLGTESHAYTTYDYWEAVKSRPYVLGDFIWAAFDFFGEAGCGRVYWENDKDTFSFMSPYPWRTSWQSDMMLTGERRPQSYYRELMWGHTQNTYLFTTHPKHFGEKSFGTPWRWEDVEHDWSFGEEWLGKPVKVDAYSTGDCVEFILNGKCIGKKVPIRLIASMDIDYMPGILEAISFKDGKEISRALLETVGKGEKLLFEAESPVFLADGMDLAYVHIYAADACGRRLPLDCRKVEVSVRGPASILAVGSGAPCTKDDIGNHACHMYHGAALVILKAHQPGHIIVQAKAEDGLTGSVVLEACPAV